MAYYTATVKATIAKEAKVECGMTERSMATLIAPVVLDANKLETEDFFSKEFHSTTSDIIDEVISLELHHYFKVELKLRQIDVNDISKVTEVVNAYLKQNKIGSKLKNVEIVSITKEKEMN